MKSQLDDYLEEMQADLEVDEINMKEVQMKLPAIKHKWIGRLMRHKSTIYTLNRKKETTKKQVAEKLKKDSMYNMSDAGLSKLIDKQPVIIEIDEQINEQQLLVEFLEKSERIFSSLSFDLKNLVEMVKLETL